MTLHSPQYLEPYAAFYEARGEAADWRRALQEAGWSAFAEQGIPTRLREAWKWTNLRALQKAEFGLDPRDQQTIQVDELPAPAMDARRIVLVNGHLREDLSDLSGLPDGLSLSPLMERHLDRLQDLPLGDLPLAALNSALGSGGLAIEANSAILEPLYLVLLSDGGETAAQSHPRLLISLAQGAELTLIQHHLGQGSQGYLNNVVEQIELGERSRLRVFALQDEAGTATHVTTRQAQLSAAARLESFRLTLGAQASRDEYHVDLNGEGAEVVLNGGSLLRGHQLGDTTTVVSHTVPGTTARETFKGVMDDRAHGVFQGKIIVAEGAQGSDGRMMNRTLLLSDGAEIDTKPELEIYADDVQCAHGATAGEIDDQALFYLRSRGIPEAKARALLIRAFLAECLEEEIEMPEELKTFLMSRIDRWMDTEESADV